jgi:CRP/FNR family cyclic AMP-dependent transcriptional regulator
VHYQNPKGVVQMALIGAGGLLGEVVFFSHTKRRATAQAAADSHLWCLTALRFSELVNRQPALALSLTLFAGKVLALRAVNRRRRVAST